MHFRSAIVFACATISWATLMPRALALSPAENPTNYITTRWDTEDGLPYNAVRHILQTSDGYLWIGTLQGLARFDGLRFTVFTPQNTPGLAGLRFTAFAETADGSLWLATSTGLSRYRDGQFTAFGTADGLGHLIIQGLCVAPDGSLWIIEGNGRVQRWVDGRIVSDVDTSGLNLSGLRWVGRDAEGAMWLAAGSNAYRYRDGMFQQFSRAEGLPEQALQMLGQTPDRQLVAATQNGLWLFENERFVPFEANDSLSSLRINVALSDRAGNFWIGTANGLDRFSDGKVVPLVDRNGGNLGVVDTLFEDREGCLWVGTATGLYRFTDRRAHSLTSDGGVTGALTLAVIQARDGSVWGSNWASGVDRFHEGGITHLARGAPLSHESITAIHEAPDGAMWLGNRGSALDRLEGGHVTTFVYQPGVISSRPVTAIHAGPDGELLAGVSRRGLLHIRDGALSPVPESPISSEGDTVNVLHRTQDGRLWMGTDKGIFERRDDRTWHPVTVPGLEAPADVLAMTEEANGTFWLATRGRGLIRWPKGQAARSYGSPQGLVDDVLFSVLDDGLGCLWIGSGRGIARIRKAEIEQLDRGEIATLHCMLFGRVDGLLSGSVPGSGSPSGVRLADGRLMMATDKGVAVIDPQLVRVNNQQPPVVIESVVADDIPLPSGSELSLPAGTNRIVIRYTALSLIAPHRLRFRYQLEGSHPGWVEAGHERSATFTHLAPGRYTFRVLAANNDGIWNHTGASVALTLQPLFYQTRWFQIVAAACLVAAIGSAFWLRLRQLKRRQLALIRANVALDQRVQARTAELSRSNDEMAQRESLFRLIFEHAPVGISWHRTDLGSNHHLNSAFRSILDLPDQMLPDNSVLAALVHPEDAARQAGMDQLIQLGKVDSYALEQRFVRKDGRQVWGLFAQAVVRDSGGRIIQVIGILEDISARKEAERELIATHKRLMEASRHAGMAEIATGVLHNVGNVLNSVNVSVCMLADGLRQSGVAGLPKLAALLHEHAHDLASFLTEDDKGRRVLPYLDTLVGHLTGEQQLFMAEVESLRSNIDHIKEIVSRQQSHAQMSGLEEKLDPAQLMEDALQMNSIALNRHGVTVVREFSPAPSILVERHKVLQILINLVQNAKEALAAGSPPNKRLNLVITHDNQKVRFVVRDNGVGIPAANLARVFELGFTTRAGGHGFGLHSSANAAHEMDGSLSVQSEGHGLGATFTLELPFARNSSAARKAAATPRPERREGAEDHHPAAFSV